MVLTPWLCSTGSLSIIFWYRPCGATTIALQLTLISGLLCHCNQRASRPGCLSFEMKTWLLSWFLCIQSTLSCFIDSISIGMLLFLFWFVIHHIASFVSKEDHSSFEWFLLLPYFFPCHFQMHFQGVFSNLQPYALKFSIVMSVFAFSYSLLMPEKKIQFVDSHSDNVSCTACFIDQFTWVLLYSTYLECN